MGFSTNYDNMNDYGLVPAGDYEVVIRNAEARSTQKGAQKLGFSLVIRNDVEQGCQNRFLFLDIWKKKEPNAQDMQVQGYNFVQLMQLARCAKLPNGKAYDTVEELCRDLIGKPLRVTVTHNTYNGKTSEKIDQLKGVNVSKFPECRHVMKEKTNPIDIPAQKPQETFVSAPSAANSLGSLDDFEEILGDGEVPF